MKLFKATPVFLTLVLLILHGVCAQVRGNDFADVEIRQSFKPFILADALMMDLGGVRILERKDNTKLIYAIAATSNKHPLHQRTVARSKALKNLLAYFNGVELDAQKKLDSKKTTIITDDEITYKIVKQLDETIIKTVRGKVQGLPTVGTWRSSDRALYYMAIGGVIDSEGKIVHEKLPE